METKNMLQNLSAAEILDFYGLSHVPRVQARSANFGQSTIFYRAANSFEVLMPRRKLGLLLLILAFGSFFAAVWPFIRLEGRFYANELTFSLGQKVSQLQVQPDTQITTIFPSPTPSHFPNPLIDKDGNPITPVNMDFAIIVPKIGINASIVPGVDPTSKVAYSEALKKGVAHSNMSYYPNEDGTVYLFSHSTNYEWFIDDLNAVFYLLKNLEENDLVVVMYNGDRYTYRIREKQVIKSKEISYLIPQKGHKGLILQTCWPPGSTAQRMLIFADLIDVTKNLQFGDLVDEI